MPTVEYETANYLAVFYPEVGGKMASLVHKPSNRELLFNNPVFQPGNLGRLNAWTSGGGECTSIAILPLDLAWRADLI